MLFACAVLHEVAYSAACHATGLQYHCPSQHELLVRAHPYASTFKWLSMVKCQGAQVFDSGEHVKQTKVPHYDSLPSFLR